MAKIKYYSSDHVIEEFYKAIASGNASSVVRVHIPRSDVFYVRTAYLAKTGNWETVDRIERSMYLEGHLSKHDVLDPERTRNWEYDYQPLRNNEDAEENI